MTRADRFVRRGFFVEGQEEVERAFRSQTNDFNRRMARLPRIVVVGPLAVAVTTTIPVIPYAPPGGFKLGKVSLTVDTDVVGDDSNYWTFELVYYDTELGLRDASEIENSTLSTEDVSLLAFDPRWVDVDLVLREGWTLALVATETGTATSLSNLTIQVVELFEGS